MLKLSFLLIAVLFFSACSHKNSGKIDYRKAVSNNNSLITLSKKDISLGNDNKILKDIDRVSLHLKSAYIKDFTESMYFTNSRGEIAIVANAFEMEENKELSFSNLKEGRVVYYDDDVLKGQHLNFNNMPIYGPTIYKGNPFAFRLSIFELDTSSAYSKNILNTLANIGSKAYPQTSPILGVLNSLGSVFLSTDSSDTEFRYSMYLDAKGGAKNLNHTFLEAGYYVFIKKDKREEAIAWENIFLDDNDFKLYEKDKNGTKKRFTQNNYLIIEINKNIGNNNVNFKESNYSNLLSSLSSLNENQKAMFDEVHKSLEQVATINVQNTNFENAKALLDELINDKLLKIQTKEYKASKFIDLISNSLNETDVKKRAISINKIDLLIEKITYHTNNSYKDFTKEVFKSSKTNASLKTQLVNLLSSLK